jgi:hypothetical protein
MLEQWSLSVVTPLKVGWGNALVDETSQLNQVTSMLDLIFKKQKVHPGLGY